MVFFSIPFISVLDHDSSSVLEEGSNSLPVSSERVEVLGDDKIFLVSEFSLSVDSVLGELLISHLEEVRSVSLLELLGNLLPVTSAE